MLACPVPFTSVILPVVVKFTAITNQANILASGRCQLVATSQNTWSTWNMELSGQMTKIIDDTRRVSEETWKGMGEGRL